jgi:hypothetical protein
MRGSLLIAAAILFLSATATLGGSQFESSKLAPGVVTQGAGVESSKLAPGVVTQGAGVESSKLAPGVVTQGAALQSSKISVGVVLLTVAGAGVIPRAPLTHW